MNYARVAEDQNQGSSRKEEINVICRKNGFLKN